MRKRGRKGTRVLTSKYNKQTAKSKRSQIDISFGMIFSIILIIAFVAVAIYAITIFLNMKKCINTGLFKEDLQSEIERARSSDEFSQQFTENLASGIEKVCFIDLSKAGSGEFKDYYDKIKKLGLVNINFFFWPFEKTCDNQKGFQLDYINTDGITKDSNPYCLGELGNVELTIEKGFHDSLVKIS